MPEPVSSTTLNDEMNSLLYIVLRRFLLPYSSFRDGISGIVDRLLLP
jgi:hypothetical protein